MDAEQILRGEEEKTWALLEDLVDDLSAFDVFLYANDYHNLKAAIKLVYLDMERPEAFFSHGTVEPETMLQAIREQEDSLLPEAMRAPAKEAFDLLLHTRDGQLCDVVIDRAALDAIYAAGKAADHPVTGLCRNDRGSGGYQDCGPCAEDGKVPGLPTARIGSMRFARCGAASESGC